MDLRGSLLLPRLSSAPSGEEGKIYYDRTTKSLRFHDGSGWVDTALLGAASLSYGRV